MSRLRPREEGSLTRRELLRLGGALTLLPFIARDRPEGLGARTAEGPSALMPTREPYLARCVAMAPLTDLTGGDPALGSPQQDLALAHPGAAVMEKFIATDTGVVRVWVDWPTIEPWPGSFDDWSRLDAQIHAAKSAGLTVILSMYRNTAWANWSPSGIEFDESDARWVKTLPDRISSATRDAVAMDAPGWALRLRRLVTAGRAHYKELGFRFPGDVSRGSAWAQFVGRVLARYSRSAPGPGGVESPWVDFFQPVNEPNYVHWPQQSANAIGDPWRPSQNTSAALVAQMLGVVEELVSEIAATGATPPVVLAPDASDTLASSRLTTPLYRPPETSGSGAPGFTELLLGELRDRGFDPGTRVGWSCHNYQDLEHGHDDGPGGRHNAHYVQQLLTAHGWTGYAHASPPAGIPKLFLTEGGVRLSATPAFQRVPRDVAAQEREQEAMLRAGYELVRNTPLGRGVLLFTQFQFYSDPAFNSGLSRVWIPVTAPDPGDRPAYGLWASLPSS